MKNTCQTCSKEFVVKFKIHKFCSTECARLNRYPPRFKTCKYCQKEFSYKSIQKDNLYCSQTCYDIARTEKTISICKFCNKEIASIKSRKAIYCDKICKYSDLSNHRKEMVGKTNPCYVHGNSRSRKYREIAKKNFIKECFYCKTTEKRLEVHHIDFDEHNNVIHNLIILCHKCHWKIHRCYEFEDH